MRRLLCLLTGWIDTFDQR